ncbi:uncharacterized protein F5891DRAFT_1047641, partial [Suillus fuscotomentosus]
YIYVWLLASIALSFCMGGGYIHTHTIYEKGVRLGKQQNVRCSMTTADIDYVCEQSPLYIPIFEIATRVGQKSQMTSQQGIRCRKRYSGAILEHGSTFSSHAFINDFSAT